MRASNLTAIALTAALAGCGGEVPKSWTPVADLAPAACHAHGGLSRLNLSIHGLD